MCFSDRKHAVAAPNTASQAREVLITLEQWRQRRRIPDRPQPPAPHLDRADARSAGPGSGSPQRLPVLAVPKSGVPVQAFEDSPPFDNTANRAAGNTASTVRGRRLRHYLDGDEHKADDDAPPCTAEVAEPASTGGKASMAGKPDASDKANIADAASLAGKSQSASRGGSNKSNGQDRTEGPG